MTDDEFFEGLRNDARALRHEGDPFFPARLRASVSSRIGAGSSVAETLFRWRRRIAVTLLAMTMAAAAGALMSAPPMTPDAISSIADAGLLREDIYSAAE